MDFSNLPHAHPLYNPQNARRPGLLKNEVPNGSIVEVVAVKPKAYAMRTLTATSNEEKLDSRAKGVKRAIKDKLPFDYYKQCIDGRSKFIEIHQRSLISKNHTNFLQEAVKIALSPLDDKRFQTCPIHSVPYGSSLIGSVCYQCKTKKARRD